ncbi:hypothetical protein [Stackebrandtia albiflava]|uniref:hypothetical protein n=1 Tax=Stackebrandtia albiflava TaxID=406432 RepID=UPI0011BFAD32|nr:hypothetical protein [Stackebrandtia albiflava]
MTVPLLVAFVLAMIVGTAWFGVVGLLWVIGAVQLAALTFAVLAAREHANSRMRFREALRSANTGVAELREQVRVLSRQLEESRCRSGEPAEVTVPDDRP